MPERVLRAFEVDYGVEVYHAWGMTEMSPMGTIGRVPAALKDASLDVQLAQKLKQGIPPLGVELKVVGEDEAELPHDGESSGRLLVRGMAVVGSYFQKDDGTGRGSAPPRGTSTGNELGEMLERSKDLNAVWRRCRRQQRCGQMSHKNLKKLRCYPTAVLSQNQTSCITHLCFRASKVGLECEKEVQTAATLQTLWDIVSNVSQWSVEIGRAHV